jgi:hypothetical protein
MQPATHKCQKNRARFARGLHTLRSGSNRAPADFLTQAPTREFTPLIQSPETDRRAYAEEGIMQNHNTECREINLSHNALLFFPQIAATDFFTRQQ